VIWRGEVYQVDLGRPIGHEPAFLRPAIVVSNDIVNNGPGELVVVVPVTSVSTARIRQRRGDVAPNELHAIDRALRFILDL
jgi:mRNA interferase MazF